MNLGDFEGKTYGPLPWRVAFESVGDFVDLTGDDPKRWSECAPPGFAAAALFAVAPDLLAELYDRSVVHGEQTFTWNSPIEIGTLLTVTGTVTRARERAGVHFVTFEMTADGKSGAVLSGRSLFLVSGESLVGGEAGFERPEPPHGYRGEIEDGQISASRADLVRYASATRDWNPVHWDHGAAAAAGFPGIVVHGLLQAGWALRAALPESVSTRPFADARFRFRNPLLPARPVSVAVTPNNRTFEVLLADQENDYLVATIAQSHE